jgi:phage N-6-adenine-methyltransferase
LSEQHFKGRTSSGDVEIGTPDEIFLPLHEEFNFTFDLAAAHEPYLHKCERYWTKEDDALSRPWPRTPLGEANWLNPPYSRKVAQWIVKARQESIEGSTTVMLLNANTESMWYQHIAVPFAHKIRHFEFRISFIKNGIMDGNGSYHPSCLLVFYSALLNIPIPLRTRHFGSKDWPRFRYVEF